MFMYTRKKELNSKLKKAWLVSHLVIHLNLAIRNCILGKFSLIIIVYRTLPNNIRNVIIQLTIYRRLWLLSACAYNSKW